MIDRKAVKSVHRGRCGVCGEPFRVSDKVEMHHAGIHNTKGNRENYPHVIHATVNILPLHAECHAHTPSAGKWPEHMAAKIETFYQAWLDLVRYAEFTETERRAIEADLRRLFEEDGE